jgi:hypothetical protein
MDEPRMWGGGAHDRLDAMNTGHAGGFWFESSVALAAKWTTPTRPSESGPGALRVVSGLELTGYGLSAFLGGAALILAGAEFGPLGVIAASPFGVGMAVGGAYAIAAGLQTLFGGKAALIKTYAIVFDSVRPICPAQPLEPPEGR